MLILKSVAHPNTTVVAEPLGDDGSVRLTPIHGERSGDCFILDADAAAELAAFITGLACASTRVSTTRAGDG